MRTLIYSLILILLISAPALAVDRKLAENVTGDRYYSCDQGPDTILVLASANGSAYKLRFWIFDSVTKATKIKTEVKKAVPKTIDLFWDKARKVYVVTYLGPDGKMYFLDVNPTTKTTKKVKVPLPAALGKPRSARTAFDPKDGSFTVLACTVTVFQPFKIKNGAIIETGAQNDVRINGVASPLYVGDISYAEKTDQYYYAVVHDLPYREIRFGYFQSANKTIKVHYSNSKSVWTTDIPDLLIGITRNGNQNENVLLFYNAKSPATGEWQTYTNFLKLDGLAGPTYWASSRVSPSHVGIPTLDSEKKQFHTVMVIKSEFGSDVGYDPVLRNYPSLRLCSYSATGTQLNGTTGTLVRGGKDWPVVSSAGALVVDGKVLVIYARNGNTWFGLASDHNY